MEAGTVFLTSAMVAPIVEAIQGNLGVLLPVGIGIFATMVGVKLIPSIIYRFL